MKELIKKILREGKGFKDSTEEDWEWAEGVELPLIDQLNHFLKDTEYRFIVEGTDDYHGHGRFLRLEQVQPNGYVYELVLILLDGKIKSIEDVVGEIRTITKEFQSTMVPHLTRRQTMAIEHFLQTMDEIMENGLNESKEDDFQWVKDHKFTTLDLLQSVFDGTNDITADVFIDIDGVRGIKLIDASSSKYFARRPLYTSINFNPDQEINNEEVDEILDYLKSQIEYRYNRINSDMIPHPLMVPYERVLEILKSTNNLNESQEDEWEWAEGVNPTIVEVLNYIFEGSGYDVLADIDKFYGVDGIEDPSVIRLRYNNKVLTNMHSPNYEIKNLDFLSHYLYGSIAYLHDSIQVIKRVSNLSFDSSIEGRIQQIEKAIEIIKTHAKHN